MNLFLSQKIKVLSLALIILVLYIHSNFHDYSHEILGMRFNHILQNVISVGLGRCAVPLFYMISGYLFFLNTENRISVVFNKMKKRIRTLLIPYIIACLFFPLFYWVMELIPIAGKYINGDGISILFRESFSEILLTLFYRGNNTSVPLAFHLWFLRDLIVIVAISPLLYFVKKIIGSGRVIQEISVSSVSMPIRKTCLPSIRPITCLIGLPMSLPFRWAVIAKVRFA